MLTVCLYNTQTSEEVLQQLSTCLKSWLSAFDSLQQQGVFENMSLYLCESSMNLGYPKEKDNYENITELFGCTYNHRISRTLLSVSLIFQRLELCASDVVSYGKIFVCDITPQSCLSANFNTMLIIHCTYIG